MASPPRDEESSGAKDLFEVARSRNLRVLLAGRLVSAGGDFVYQVALSIAIFAYAHQSSLAVSAFWIVRLAPPLVLGSPVGALAARLGYRRAMIIADVGRLVLVAVMALVAPPATWGDTLFFNLMLIGNRVSGLLAATIGLTIAILSFGVGVLAVTGTDWINLRRQSQGGPDAESLARVPSFQDVPAGVREWAVRRMVREQIRPGSVIIRQGDEGEKFYIIAKGTAQLEMASD
jgi:hypothetical protein